MEEKINELEPKNVFKYFKEISMIPHGSGNTAKISEYCTNFAKSHNLRYIKDEYNNVIIYKEATYGYENHETIILQGHLDMVCEKTLYSNHNFEKDSLKLYIEDDFIKAKETTLGADDGIAVAYLLSILEDKELKHPRLEVLFTVDEEIGMLGAIALNEKYLEGKKLINIDSEEEGIFTVSCAGGLRADITIDNDLKIITDKENKTSYEIEIKGLKGGHSGTEIICKRANANILLGKLMNEINKKINFDLISTMGGSKDNAIASYSKMQIALQQNDEEKLNEIVKNFENEIKKTYENIEENIKIEMKKIENNFKKVISEESKNKIINILSNIHDGIKKMSSDIENLVETSSNCGILKSDEEKIFIKFSIRSSIENEKWNLYKEMEKLALDNGCECKSNEEYPGWKYKNDSILREKAVKTYKNMYNKEPVVSAIHAGLECGIFAKKIRDIDMISYGPDIYDAHTPNERLSINSTKRVWEYTKNLLENL